MRNLILLHGALGHNNLFNPYLNALSESFNVYTPLFSEHGNTELATNGITIEKYIQELSEFIEEKNLEDVCIFGHSMGGYVALCYTLENSEKVNSVMTLGTKFDWTEEQALKESKMLNPDIIIKKNPKYAELLESQHGPNWKKLLPAMAEMMISLGENPPLHDEVLKNIEIPVQIMVGDQDNMVTIEESTAVYRKLTKGKLAVLPNTKHPLEKARPDLLLNLMQNFWNMP